MLNTPLPLKKPVFSYALGSFEHSKLDTFYDLGSTPLSYTLTALPMTKGKCKNKHMIITLTVEQIIGDNAFKHAQSKSI